MFSQLQALKRAAASGRNYEKHQTHGCVPWPPFTTHTTQSTSSWCSLYTSEISRNQTAQRYGRRPWAQRSGKERSKTVGVVGFLSCALCAEQWALGSDSGFEQKIFISRVRLRSKKGRKGETISVFRGEELRMHVAQNWCLLVGEFVDVQHDS